MTSTANGLRSTLLAALTTVCATVPAARAQDVGLPVGTVPERVTLEDLDGNPADLAPEAGKPLLVEFWATWCPLCRALQPRLDAAYERFGEHVTFRVVAVGVNQSPRSVRRHLERHPLPYPVLWDGEGRAVRAYMTPTTSYVVILDAAGRVAYTGTGGDQEIAAALERLVDE
jgi:thiol-disulfide isomerase/thioredoxin